MGAIFNFIISVIGYPLGLIMYLCVKLVKNYGIALILFTLITKIIMFPLNLIVQKNSIKMVNMKPELDALRYQYTDDKDAYYDAQQKLYKKEKYSPMAGVWPLLLQIPIILGLINVVYHPLRHIIRMPSEVISEFTAAFSSADYPELMVLEKIGELGGELTSKFGDYVNEIKALDMNFLGIDLAARPDITVLNWLLIIPILSGLSTVLLCVIQNKINVLQIEQSKAAQWGVSIFTVAFSTYFAFIVPTGVGLYWIFGNLFAIVVMYLVNVVYDPKKYIDYEALEDMKKKNAEELEKKKRCRKLAKKYYKKFVDEENCRRMKLMFYSEGAGYYKYFANIIDAVLIKSKLKIHYVTSDPDDPILNTDNERIIPYYVDETRLISLMMKVEADMVIMTTPDLEKYQIKRSRVKKDVEYVYTEHGCTSLNLTYRTGALDYFDTIFAVSPRQADEVRALEELRHTKKKKIVEVGYCLIDNMIAAYDSSEKKPNDKKTILIAPSWQYDNIIDSCLDGLVDGLTSTGYRVIIRPHPQYIKRFPMKINEIKKKYADRFSEDFIFETDFSSNVTVYTADLLITDWSAISFEYSFTTGKPTLFINTQMKVVNRAYKKIKIVPYDIAARNIIGKSIEKDEIGKIGEAAAELIENQSQYTEQILKEREEYFYNLGRSGEAAADYIVERLVKKHKKKTATADTAENKETAKKSGGEPFEKSGK